jgi:hypothetical protein
MTINGKQRPYGLVLASLINAVQIAVLNQV